MTNPALLKTNIDHKKYIHEVVKVKHHLYKQSTLHFFFIVEFDYTFRNI